MRISTKLRIAGFASLLAFALFAGFSRNAILEVRSQEGLLARLNEIAREFSALVLEKRSTQGLIAQSLIANQNSIRNSLIASEQLLKTLSEADLEPSDQEMLSGMLIHIQQYSKDFEELVEQRNSIIAFNQTVRTEIEEFGTFSANLIAVIQNYRRDLDSTEETIDIAKHSRLKRFRDTIEDVFGWSATLPKNSKNDFYYKALESISQNFDACIQDYENQYATKIDSIKIFDLQNVDSYLDCLNQIMQLLHMANDTFAAVATREPELIKHLEEQVTYLQHSLEQMIVNKSTNSQHQEAHLRLIFFLSVTALFSGSIGLTIWFSLGISRPINQLARNFKAVAGGDFDLQVPALGNSELNDLARAFNDMTEKLRCSYAQVEEKVRLRTEELQLATARAEKLADLAQNANMAKSAFLTTMSHEIRTPLNSIIGFSEMLQDTPMNAEQLEDLQAIQSSGRILLDLINEILDLSKIEAGKLQLEYSQVDLRETAAEVVGLFRLSAGKKNIKISLEFSDDFPQTVYSDRTRLQQLLNNLLSNAVKFTAEGEINIRIWVEDDADGHRYYVSVSDTGIGIPEDKIDDVFLAFTQADSSTTRKYGGTGLGLAICFRIVEMLGGKISVVSKLGSGSTFTFYFKGQGERMQPALADKDATVLELNLDASTRVLVVEDNSMNFKLIQKKLKRHGLYPIWAKDGDEAIRQIEAFDYDLIFMDLQMPDIDGWEVARKIRQLCADRMQPYIAALTASALTESRDACRTVGMQDFVTKPISSESLKIALMRYQKYRSHQQETETPS